MSIRKVHRSILVSFCAHSKTCHFRSMDIFDKIFIQPQQHGQQQQQQQQQQRER